MILRDGIDLALREIHLLTEEGILCEGVVAGVVDSDTLAVVADDDTVVAVAVDRRYFFVASGGHMDEIIVLLAVEAGVGSHIDMSIVVGTELSEDEFPTVCEVTLQRLAVVTEQSLLFRDHPETPLFVLQQGVDGMEVGEDPAELTGRLFVGHLHHTEAGGTYEQVAIGPFEETGGIAVVVPALMVEECDIMELFAVPGLEGTVHAKIEQAMPVLNHTIHVVAGQRLVGLILLFEDTELIAVVAVDAITGGDPEETILIKIDLRNETTGQLMIISCEIFAHLSMQAHG